MMHDILAYDGKIITREQIRQWLEQSRYMPYYDDIRRLWNKAQSFDKIRLKLGPKFREKLNPLCGMNGFDRFVHMRMDEGMNKPLNEEEYKLITRTVIETLKRNDIAFTKRWIARLEKGKKYYTIAYRWDRKIPYRGKVNQLTLVGLWPFTPPLTNPYYLTPGKIRKAGGKLKPGAKPKPAFFYNVLYRTPRSLRERGLDFRTYKRDEMKEFLMDKADIKPADVDKYISNHCTVPFLKHYTVYNGEDVDGIDFKLDQKTFEGEITGAHVYKEMTKLPAAEAIVKAYPEPKPAIRHKFQDEAYYSPSTDTVMMPQMKQFNNAAQYYGTLFHELVHSTGHPSRLNRKKPKKEGDKIYAFEELVAELGAVYLSALAGFLYDNIKNSAAYLKGWRRRLIKNMRDDDRFIVMAASQAQKAVDFMTENLDREKLEKLKAQAPKPKKKPSNKKKSETQAKPKANEKKAAKKAPAVKQRSNKLTKARIISYLRSIKPGNIPFVQVGPDGILVTDGAHTAVYKPKDIKLPEKTVRLPHEIFLKQLKDITEIHADGTIVMGNRKLKLVPVEDERIFKVPKGKFQKVGIYNGEKIKKIESFTDKNIDDLRLAKQSIYFDTKNKAVVVTDFHMLIWDPVPFNPKAPSFMYNPYNSTGRGKYKLPLVDFEVSKSEKNIFVGTAGKEKLYIEEPIRFNFSEELVSYSVPLIGSYPRWPLVVPEKRDARHVYQINRNHLVEMLKETLDVLYQRKEGLVVITLQKNEWNWNGYSKKNECCAEFELVLQTKIPAQHQKGEPGVKIGFNPYKLYEIVKWFEHDDTITFHFHGTKRAIMINDTALLMPMADHYLNGPEGTAGPEGLNFPGLNLATAIPENLKVVKNPYKGKELSLEEMRKKVEENIFKYDNTEILNHFFKKTINIIADDDILKKNIKGRKGDILTDEVIIGYENLVYLLKEGKNPCKYVPKPNHKKIFGAKWMYSLDAFLQIDDKIVKYIITLIERNHDIIFYFLKTDKNFNEQKNKPAPQNDPAFPKGPGMTGNDSAFPKGPEIKGQVCKNKNKSKNPKSQDPDKKNNKGLEAPAVISLKTLKNKRFQTWKLSKEPLAKFLGDIERKENGSIAVTLDAPQGAGKTRMLFQFADMFARNGHKVLFFSLEEHPESRLFVKKVKEYISPKAEKNIYVTGEVPENWREIIPDYDVILIDSWNKLYKEVWEKEDRRLDFDYDLRRRYDGKLFIVVFQRTQDGKMRGGSQAQFDGDIILKIDKRPDFRENEVYYDKNRYMIDNYRWNIYGKKLMRHEAKI